MQTSHAKRIAVNCAYFQAFAVVQFSKYRNYTAPFRNRLGAMSGIGKDDFRVDLGKMSQCWQKEGPK